MIDLLCNLFQIIMGVIFFVMAYESFQKNKKGEFKRKTSDGREVEYTSTQAKNLIKWEFICGVIMIINGSISIIGSYFIEFSTVLDYISMGILLIFICISVKMFWDFQKSI